jgi:hypothetical protein
MWDVMGAAVLHLATLLGSLKAIRCQDQWLHTNRGSGSHNGAHAYKVGLTVCASARLTISPAIMPLYSASLLVEPDGRGLQPMRN